MEDLLKHIPRHKLIVSVGTFGQLFTVRYREKSNIGTLNPTTTPQGIHYDRMDILAFYEVNLANHSIKYEYSLSKIEGLRYAVRTV